MKGEASCKFVLTVARWALFFSLWFYNHTNSSNTGLRFGGLGCKLKGVVCLGKIMRILFFWFYFYFLKVDQFLIPVQQRMHTHRSCLLRGKSVQDWEWAVGKPYFKLALLRKLKVSIIKYPISPSYAGCLRDQWRGLVPKNNNNLKYHMMVLQNLVF